MPDIIQPDRDIKRFKVETNDGRVQLDLFYMGMMESYYVSGFINGEDFIFSFENASEAYDKYNFYFVDAKAEATALLVKATGVHV